MTSISSPILDAIDAACGTMGRVFAEDGLPDFAATMWPVASLEFEPEVSEAHVPGRHVNALLLAEAIGRTVDDSTVNAHRDALFFSYSGGAPLPLNRAEKSASTPTIFLPHNVREGFHGLHALARYRDDSRALALIEQSVAYILHHWNPSEGWDRQVADETGWSFGTVPGIGRALGPLVKILELTGDRSVRRLADLIATKLLTEHYLPEGDFDVERFGRHVHSITSSLSSLAQYARFTGDRAALDAAKAFYGNGMWALRDALGWAGESFVGPELASDLGEANTTGDLVETALILADEGDTSYLDDAERMIQSYLLPAQMRDVAIFAQDPDETLRKLEGSWGFAAPYGHLPVGVGVVMANTDVVGGTASSLCQAVVESVRVEKGIPTVRLYLDAEREGVRASLDGGTARVAADAVQVAIRVPRFDGTSGGFRSIDPRAESEVSFPIERETIVLRHPQRDIRARVMGNRVEAMDAFGQPFAFFPPYEIIASQREDDDERLGW
jgi:hypothetical protein